ncbi:hypothetical protein RN001_009236 [Aquatica leii]|uniref:Uncharacterized protein n=1 Tax=Aquatica leii TaxID=1421715 RepID=A0AAN7NZB0_9COLE|nr:hypothetical protein RN001_009236 [Aquatica leii]
MLTLKLSIILVLLVSFSKGIKIFPTTRQNLIWYKSDNPNTYADYVNELDALMLNQQDRKSDWALCTSSNSYGFSLAYTGPCVFLSFPEKLQETPESYNSTTLPADAPGHLRNYIKSLEPRRIRETHNLAYITCYGAYPLDIENIGPIQFFRNIFIGILPYSAPTTFTKDVVAVYFEKPMRNIIINVECKIWAKFKTKQDLDNSVVAFDLLID